MIHLEAVVGPAAELHDAGLLVEGEVLDVHLAGGVVDGRRLPLHQPGVEQRGLGRQRHLEVAVSAAQGNERILAVINKNIYRYTKQNKYFLRPGGWRMSGLLCYLLCRSADTPVYRAPLPRPR